MKDKTPRIVKYAFIALLMLLGLMVLFINRNLASLADLIYPGSALWAHLGLLGVELLALLWFWKGLFGGRRHLLLVDGATPDEERLFVQELARRMRSNPHIQEAGISPSGTDAEAQAEYLERCLALLNTKADEEIRQNARRIFLATALSQNGRIDAIIMFASLCRLVWRVSSIYNQQPHPREIASLYWAVISATFLALSIEELDIATEITVGFGEAFHAMVPAGLTASIPFAGKALQTFTASTIDGAANCYLALRAGIVTRNAYAYAAKMQERPGRAAVFREAGAQLFDMSQVLVNRLAGALAENLAGAAKLAGGKTVQVGKDMVDTLGQGAGKLATGTVSAVQGAGSGVLRAGGKAASSTWKVIKKPFER